MSEQRARTHSRDAWDTGKGSFGGRLPSGAFRPLRVGGSIAAWRLQSAMAEAFEPQCGVERILRPQDDNSEIGQSKQCAADGRRGQWPVVGINAFDEHVREACRPAQPPNLAPECTADDRRVKAADGLPLHDRARCEDVIACGEVLEYDAHVQFGEKLRHSAWTLVHVGNDPNHPQRITHGAGRNCSKRATEATHLLALSRSESA